LRCGKRPKRAITSAVLPDVAELLLVAELGEQQHAPVLVGQILAVLERHVEEAALLGFEVLVEVFLQRSLGDRQGEVVRGELVGMSAEHVARELVEQDHGSERGQRVVDEAPNWKLALPGPEFEEAFLDAVGLAQGYRSTSRHG